GEETTVIVTYDAEPRRGLYFRTPEMGYPAGDTHLFTQGESHEAPHWYPNYDYPNERFRSEVICRVPPEMTVVSNGRRVSEETDEATGLKAVHWLQEKPHVNYLVALVVGNFEKIESRYRNIPLTFYTPASQIAHAAGSFRDTADMLAFYEREIGVPYPWDKYAQAAVTDFVAGGMENTSLTILTDRTLFTTETENLRSSQGLVAHEMVHQWFGDYVTCKDWSHLWLNEGFAVYYEMLYDGHKNGRDALLYELYRSGRQIASRDANGKPIVTRTYRHAGEQFDYRAYGKGAWVLHMLRSQLGEGLFRRIIQTYLERHALGVVVSEDLRSIIEELSGRSFDRFFDQWLYHGGCPNLKVSYSWSEKDKLAKISVEQTPAAKQDAMPFALPTKVRFYLDDQTFDRDVNIDAMHHDFYFALHARPRIVRFDPELTVLAQVTFDKPRDMLYAQRANTTDVIGRLLAVDALKQKKDKKTVAELKKALRDDPFYGVRRSAAAALREIHTDEAFEALLDSMEQPDARVRLQVVEEIGRFYRPESLAALEKVLATEKNPDIVAEAIRNIGRYHAPQTRQAILQHLRSDSYRNALADAALRAIRTLDDSSFVPEVMETLDKNEARFTSRGFAGGLETLARIARDEDDKTRVREFLLGYVNHPKQTVQRGAISALGTLGDPKAIPVVETFCGNEPYDRTERCAKSALETLQRKKELVPGEIVELRRMVDDLKKETEKLKEELEDLKKQAKARAEAATDSDADAPPEPPDSGNTKENPDPNEPPR
ncbi:MAG: M1 family metallopeptidase, partial [Sedimentisphaerales bacterium]|nr:M1 family metallopeptidase [Sedimentisphaerales bacterium]